MNRLPIFLIAGVAAIGLAACGGPSPERPAEKQETAKLGPASVNTPYTAIAAGKVDIEGGLVDVAARAPGVVKEVFVQEGDKVTAGQILARQEDDDARLSRNRVAAQLAQAEAQVPILEVQLAAALREQKRLERLIDNSVGRQPFFEFFRAIVMDFASRLAGERDPGVTVWSELERDPELALAWKSYEHRQIMMLAAYVAAEYGLPADDYRPVLVSGLMVSASWEAHRRWSGDTRRLNLERETLAAINVAEAMAKAVLARPAASAKTPAAPRKRAAQRA